MKNILFLGFLFLTLFSCAKDVKETTNNYKDNTIQRTSQYDDSKAFYNASLSLTNYVKSQLPLITSNQLEICFEDLTSETICQKFDDINLGLSDQFIVDFINNYNDVMDGYIGSYGNNYLSYLADDLHSIIKDESIILINERNDNETNTPQAIGTPCTDQFDHQMTLITFATNAVVNNLGVAAGVAYQTYMTWQAVNDWCDCMTSTYANGC